MAECEYCGRDLPGFESVCRQCYAANYSRLTKPEAAAYQRRWVFVLIAKIAVSIALLAIIWSLSSTAVLITILALAIAADMAIVFRYETSHRESRLARLAKTMGVTVFVGLLCLLRPWIGRYSVQDLLQRCCFVACTLGFWMVTDRIFLPEREPLF